MKGLSLKLVPFPPGMDFFCPIRVLRRAADFFPWAAVLFALALMFRVEPVFAGPPLRIVSMSPSITEILFAIDAGPRVVGVTDFCKYPPAVTALQRVGGLLNPSFETIVSLKPDLVIHQHDSLRVQQSLRDLGIQTLPVNLVNLENILKSILIIGEALDGLSPAQQLHDKLEREIDSYKIRLAGRKRKSVLMILGDSQDPLRDLYAVGKGTFLDELLTLAGGENILDRSLAVYPKVSKEFILRRSPEAIVEAIPRSNFSPSERMAHIAEWRRFPAIQAVKNDAIHFLAEDYILIPGPRLLSIVDQLARAIHPELFGDGKKTAGQTKDVRP
ncbi:MAG: ABC transporter substrate-binding protein [Nitrospinae bacterium]|nr:ABC transporter substrate-binding protein [Nitrospinota bacterium]